jgi:hypothetical protein
MLFLPSQQELSDEEIAAVLRQEILRVGAFRGKPTYSWPKFALSIWLRACGKRVSSWHVPHDGGCIGDGGSEAWR